MKNSLVLLSGGLDSVVLTHQLKKKGDNLRAIYLNFGPLSSLGEMHSAKLTANLLNIPIEIVNMTGLADMLSTFYPPNQIRAIEYDTGTGPGPEPDPDHHYDFSISGYYIITAIASHYSLLSGFNNVSVAILKEQTENNKNFEGFFTHWNSVVRTLNPEKEFELQAPFNNMNKKDVVILGHELNIDMSKTWSCYNNYSLHCGECLGCLERKNAFKEANIQDKTNYLCKEKDLS